VFDPKKKWNKKEIQDLINQEHPLYSIINKYTLEDLLNENSDISQSMNLCNISTDYYTCKNCNKRIAKCSKIIHNKFCKNDI
jgi:hypothetical protein